MPFYEYTCGKCGETFELLVRNADEKVRCPKCGATPKKMLSSFAARASSGGSSSSSCPTCSGGTCNL